jgi:two-component system sensor histidine kinase PilS (NtrC family)
MNQAQTDALLRRSNRGSRDALLQKTMDEPELGWRVLITLNAFRLLISTTLLLLFAIGSEPHFFGDARPTACVAGYLVFAILSAVSLRQQWVPRTALAVTQLVADIAAIVLLMHASGGISSGLGTVSATLAALATFAILGEHAYSQIISVSSTANYPAAGILSAIIFAIALASQPLARRIRATEALAHQFGVDLKNLSELNQYIVQHLRESIVVVDARSYSVSTAPRRVRPSPAHLRPLPSTSRNGARTRPCRPIRS